MITIFESFINKYKYDMVLVYINSIEDSKLFQELCFKYGLVWIGRGEAHYLSVLSKNEYLAINLKKGTLSRSINNSYNFWKLMKYEVDPITYTIKDIKKIENILKYGLDVPSYKPKSRTLESVNEDFHYNNEEILSKYKIHKPIFMIGDKVKLKSNALEIIEELDFSYINDRVQFVKNNHNEVLTISGKFYPVENDIKINKKDIWWSSFDKEVKFDEIWIPDECIEKPILKPSYKPRGRMLESIDGNYLYQIAVFKVSNEEENKMIQDILFKNGFYWYNNLDSQIYKPFECYPQVIWVKFNNNQLSHSLYGQNGYSIEKVFNYIKSENQYKNNYINPILFNISDIKSLSSIKRFGITTPNYKPKKINRTLENNSLEINEGYNIGLIKNRLDIGLDIYIYVENKLDALSFYNFLKSKRNLLIRNNEEDINNFYKENLNHRYLTFRIYKDNNYFHGRIQSYPIDSIKNLKGFINYPENNKIIFELLEINPPRYSKKILESKEQWPYRFKTKKEFEKEYGENWRNIVNFNSAGDMDYLCGTVLEKDFNHSMLYDHWYINIDMLTKNEPEVPNYKPKKFNRTYESIENKYPYRKIVIKVTNEYENKIVQEKLYSLGCSWPNYPYNSKVIEFFDRYDGIGFIFVEIKNKKLTKSDSANIQYLIDNNYDPVIIEFKDLLTVENIIKNGRRIMSASSMYKPKKRLIEGISINTDVKETNYFKKYSSFIVVFDTDIESMEFDKIRLLLNDKFNIRLHDFILDNIYSHCTDNQFYIVIRIEKDFIDWAWGRISSLEKYNKKDTYSKIYTIDDINSERKINDILNLREILPASSMYKPKKINKTLESLDYDKYLIKLINNYNDNKRAQEALDDYKSTLNKLQKEGGILYRVVFLKNIEDLKKDKLGEHWTIYKDDISRFFENIRVEDDVLFPYLITGKFAPKSLKIEDSWETFVEIPDEMEVCIKKQPINYTIEPYFFNNEWKIKFIQQQLLDLNDYNRDEWEYFIDNQSMGDCQLIVKDVERIALKYKIEGVEKHFGHIELDEPYYNAEDDEETTVFTHWWNTIDGEIVEFSKGTLQNFIEWEDLYNIEVFNEEEKYKLL